MRNLGALSVGLLSVSLLVGLASAAHANDSPSPVDVGLKRGGVGVGSSKWVRDPQSGEMLPELPGVVSDDPNQYKPVLQCQVGENFDKKCLPGQLQCPPREPGGKPGTAVIWKVAPRALENPTWSDWKSASDGPSCLYDEKPEDLLARIAGRILSEFRTLPIKPAALGIQPSPHTLRGAETNVFADAVEQRFDVVILGQKVRVVATPAEYTYNYGDGGGLGPTMFAGGPLPEERWGEQTRTSHVYKQTGDFQVSVSTMFRGTYSVNGGPDLPIPGTGEFASPAQTVSVWRSVTRNYADNCLQNPQGEGCPGVPSK